MIFPLVNERAVIYSDLFKLAIPLPTLPYLCWSDVQLNVRVEL